jgi:hypothetical protein
MIAREGAERGLWSPLMPPGDRVAPPSRDVAAALTKSEGEPEFMTLVAVAVGLGVAIVVQVVRRRSTRR